VDRTRLYHSPSLRLLVVVFVLMLLCGIFVMFSGQSLDKSPLWLAGSAVLTSFVALGSPLVQKWILHPVLRVSYVRGEDYCEYAIAKFERNKQECSVDAYYFRLLISNKGSIRAEKVEVLATNLWKQQLDGSRLLDRCYSMNLIWTHIGKTILDGISPETGRFCDIGYCLCPQQTDKAILSLELEARANRPRHLLEPGTYELGLVISAANHQPIYKRLEIVVTGMWSDDLNKMANDGIRIRLI
jgi:hypothetical protein